MNHDHQDIEAVLQTYFDGVYEDDPKKIAAVAHECFHMECPWISSTDVDV
jgi:hypothetical protein